ncbi:MAG: hypothetical protein LBJ89_03840, partial [Holosporales bacterium]|nr:hypothetical protein [Holosporales bacterium]
NKTGLTDAQIELVLILSDRESERIFSTSSLSNFRPVTGNLHYDFEYFRHTFMNMLANRSSFSRIMPFLKDQTIILSYLKSIFDDFKSLLNRIENASPISILNQTEVVANQAEIFFRLCTGRGERLFNISKLGNPRLFLYANIDDLEIFQNALRQMLGNRSGFQRIMSLLAVNTINQDARTPFTKGFKSVSIEISARCPYNVAETNSICNYFDGTININIRKLDEYRELANGFMVSLFRAMSHVYHDMLGVNMQNLNRWLSNASIMNSSPFNFIYEFFPMLTHARMDPILKKIVDNITDPTDLSSEGHEFILNIITFAMSQGFGNVLLSDISTKDLRSNAWITKEIMAKCMYLYSFVMTADKTVSSDGLWTSSEEKITMRGNDIFLINQQIFMIEDRQNKSIYTVREKRRDAEFIKTREFHQFHSSLQVSSCALFTEACNTLGIANPLSNQDIARIFVPLGNKYTTTENPFYKISEPTILSQPSLNYFCGLRHACSFDTSKELEEGLDAKQVDLTTINTCRGVCTPLVIAISGGQTNLFKKLLNKGADPLIGGSFSALSVCISEINVDAVEYILNHIKGPISSEDAYYVIRALIAIFSTHDPANNIVKERIYSCVFPFMIPFINTDDFFKNQNITGLLNDCISACSWGGNTSSLMNLIQFFLSSENLSLNSEFIGQRVLIRQSINTVFKEKYLLFCQKMNRQITKCEEALNLR